LLARFLSAPPAQADLAAAAALSGDAGALGRAMGEFASLCAGGDAGLIGREFHDLFIGLSRGELIPYGSYYLTGFLNEKPLAKLRQDMARLGIARAKSLADPEDHIASLCEMMAVFIEGTHGCMLSLPEQKAFFGAHIAPWAPVFFRDLEGAKGSKFYAALAAIGNAFLDIERQAFAMV
jgi:TorA maturation chaperone TorD